MANLTGLAAHLANQGLLAITQAKKALQQAQSEGLPFISYITKNKILSCKEIIENCAKNFGLSMFDLKDYDFTWLQQSPFPHELIYQYRILPLDEQQGTLRIGIADPTDQVALDAIQFHTGRKLNPVLLAEDQLNQFLEKHFPKPAISNYLELSLLNKIPVEEIRLAVRENTVNYDEHIIKYVNNLIRNALHKSASDIHIEPYEKQCRIRFRQDGLLYTITDIPNDLAQRVATRLKVMAKLDIAERRLPQDGRMQLDQDHRVIDIRINTCPTLFGEKIVLRLLDKNQTLLDIHSLGFSDEQKNTFLQMITKPQGLILVTGPTGSGKTVTLYSALNHLNKSDKNISTVEDPIEIQLGGINQVNVNPKIGLHFATALRTFLRQDPDIMMVGEIRDGETAEIAIQAAQTGHLVFSTLHTNSAIETLSRLQSMGVALYNMISSVVLIISQRLVRKLCKQCKQSEIIPAKALGKTVIKNNAITAYRPIGCKACLDGYRGRVGIYELMPITESLSQSIITTNDITALLPQIQSQGFCDLRQMALQKVIQGETSLAEINRVIQL